MRRLARAALVLAVLALAWTAIVWLTGGIDASVAGWRLSSNDPLRPLLVAGAACTLALLAAGAAGFRSLVLDAAGAATPFRVVVLLAAVIVAAGLTAGSWTASGADSYAYVSQAELFRQGRLSRAVPLAAEAPWPDAVRTFTPFGYRPAPDGTAAIVPVTAAGLPLLMAAAQSVGGHCAAFLLTPLAGGFVLLLTFAIGREVRSPLVGAWAAWLVATSPAFLFMLMWPMSDMPATAATALMIWLALRGSDRTAFGAGLAGGTAFLIRANLLTAAGATGVWLLATGWTSRGSVLIRLRRPLLFASGLLPGLALAAWLNSQWYGSALASGYGGAGDVFSAGRVIENAARYLRWLTESSPLAWAGLAALALPFVRRFWGKEPATRRSAWLMALTSCAVGSVYLLYLPFEEWWYLRFLLPAWPALFVATAICLAAVADANRGWRVAAIATLVAAGIGGVLVAKDRGVMEIGVTEGRYVTVAHLVDLVTPPEAVILTVHHAGPIHYYAGRETLRWDELDPSQLDAAMDWLQQQGRRPLILLDDWEQPAFEHRFGGTRNGSLSYPPRAAWQSTRVSGWVRIYDPVDRASATFQPGPALESAQPWCAAPFRPDGGSR